jgi:two-component system sensor histidine kinase RegB
MLARNPGILHGLGNIVENAVDFAKREVTIQAAWSGDEVEIVVTDDGPGFADDIINEIGNPYVSWRNKGGKTPQGLGLGIFIAKTLLERSGATIGVKNRAEPKQGAIVRVVWPRAKLTLKPKETGGANAPESGIHGRLAGEPAAE